MFAIAFDLKIAAVQHHHSKGTTPAYADIATALARFKFCRNKGSVHVCDSEAMANLFEAIGALKAMPWFPPLVRDVRALHRDVRALRIEQWSDFTPMMQRA